MEGLACFGPVGGEDLGELAGGHGRETGEDVLEVGKRVDPSAAAAFDDRVEDGSPLPGSGLAHEEPVLFPKRGGSDGVFDAVVVDLHAAVSEIHGKRGPLGQRVVDGLAEEAFGPMPRLVPNEGAVEAFNDRAAVAGSGGDAQRGAGFLFAEGGFDLVEQLDLAEEPAADLGGFVRGLRGTCVSHVPSNRRA